MNHAQKPLLLPKTIQFTIGSVKPARNSPKRQPIDDGSSDDEDVVSPTFPFMTTSQQPVPVLRLM